MTKLARAVGLATAAYSVAVTVAPQLLAKPAGLTDPAGNVSRRTGLLIRGIGIRDTAIGLGMLAARSPQAVRGFGLARVAADAGDAITFGTLLSGPTRWKVVGVAAGWGLLSALSTALVRDK